MIWSRGYARAAILGSERTMNPSAAALSIIKKHFGAKRARQAVKKASYGRRPFHRGNPLPAAVIAASSIVKKLLGGRFKKPSEVRAAALAPSIVAAANGGNLTAALGLLARAERPMKVAESNVWKAAAAQLAPNVVAAARKQAASIPAADQAGPEQFAQSVLASPVQLAAAAAATSPAAGFLDVLGQPGTIRAIASAAKPRRAARGRYPSYVDRYGRQRYSSKPPGAELRIPQGATPSPGTPYSFFRGAVGGGGALKTAGQLAVAAGAGIAAYLVTQRLLQHLGGAAQRKEEAGVKAAMALRQARADLEKQQGHPVTAAQAKEMGAAYKAQLIELGYDPVTFTYKRGAVSRFLEAYNPLD